MGLGNTSCRATTHMATKPWASGQLNRSDVLQRKSKTSFGNVENSTRSLCRCGSRAASHQVSKESFCAGDCEHDTAEADPALLVVAQEIIDAIVRGESLHHVT